MATQDFARIPKSFIPGNLPQSYSDTYNTVEERVGFRRGGSTIEQLKKKAGHTTNYLPSNKAFNSLISMENNIRAIASGEQPKQVTFEGNDFAWCNNAPTSTSSWQGSPAVEQDPAQGASQVQNKFIVQPGDCLCCPPVGLVGGGEEPEPGPEEETEEPEPGPEEETEEPPEPPTMS